jgi:vitamin B12 transporter
MFTSMAIFILSQPQEQEPPPLPPKPPGSTELRVETPTRSSLNLKESPFAVSVVGRDEMDTDRSDTTTEALRALPGVHMVLSGRRGYITSVFTRGTDSAHTLVLMDGFKVNQDGDNFNHFELYTPRGLGSIEIYRGPGSAVYGSSAAGGVINLISEKGEGKPRALASGAYGSFETNLEHAQAIGRVGELSFNLAGARTEQIDGGFPNSGFLNHQFGGRVDYQLAQRAALKIVGRYLASRTDIYTNGAGDRLSPLDPDSFVEDEAMLVGVEGTFGPAEYLEIVVRGSVYWKDLGTTDVATPGDGDFGPFISSTLFYRYNGVVESRLRPIPEDTISIGVEGQFERFDRESNFGDTFRHRDAGAVFAQNELRLFETVFVVAGMRYEDNQFFGKVVTGRVGAAYWIEQTGTKVRSSWGNAITAPSFLDLFGFGGNPNLEAERVETLDGGVDQWLLGDAVRVSATGFYNQIRDLIVFSGGQVRNIGRARTWGGEFEAEWLLPWLEGLSVRMAYTLLKTYDASTRRTLIRRPEHSGRVGVSYRGPQFGASADASIVGERKDFNFSGFPAVRETVPGFVKVDLGAFVRIGPNLRVFGRIENALDVPFQEIRGFTGQEFSGLVGIEAGLEP